MVHYQAVVGVKVVAGIVLACPGQVQTVLKVEPHFWPMVSPVPRLRLPSERPNGGNDYTGDEALY